MIRQRGTTRRLGTDEYLQAQSRMQVQWRAYYGSLIDFLKRGNVEVWEFHHEMKVWMTYTDDRLTEDALPEATTAYAAACQALYREAFSCAMLDSVVSFWTDRQDPEWQCPSPAAVLRKQAADILKMKQQSICLKVEVDNWFLQNVPKAREIQVGSQESPGERLERLQEFWPQMHSLSKGVPVSTDASVHERDRHALSAENPQGVTIHGIPHWKVRPFQSQCSFGSWDWARGALGKSQSMGELASQHSPSKTVTRSPSKTTTTRVPSKSSLSSSTGKPRITLAPDFSAFELPTASPTPAGAFRSSASRATTLTSPPPPPMGSSWGRPTPAPLRAQTPDAALTRHPPTYNKGWVTKAKHIDIMSYVQEKKNVRLTTRLLGKPPEDEDGKPPRVFGRSHNEPLSVEVSKAFSDTRSARLQLDASGGKRSPLGSVATQYLQACQARGIVPLPMPFATGHSLRVDARHRILSDLDLAALETVVRKSGAEEVDLEGNGGISEAALAKFITALAEQPPQTTLRSLGLKGCARAGPATLGVVVRMLTEPELANGLTHLDLSGVPMSVHTHYPLCKAVGSHTMLETLRIAETGFGSVASTVNHCLEELLNCRTLRTLDLGWSCLSAAHFSRLGELVVASQSLQSLHLVCCSAVADGGRGITPVAHFAEHLARDSGLTHVDLSLNRIDFRCALVLEVALSTRKRLTSLDLSQNPLGVIGSRSILRLLARNESGLLNYRGQGSGTGDGPSELTDKQSFSATKPEGRYVLDLCQPYHRALLQMLYITTERFGLTPQEAFLEVATSPPWEHPAIGPGGLRAIPDKGKLAVAFSVEKAYQRGLQGVGDGDLGLFVRRRMELGKLQPGFRKVRPLLAHWKGCEGLYQEQMVFLQALAKDFFVTLPFIEQLCQFRPMIPDVLSRLLPCLLGGVQTQYIARLLAPSVVEQAQMLLQAHRYINFNPDNPTGRYRLDLANAADASVAEQVALLDQWECSVKERAARVDTSEKGNHSHLRNVQYADRPLPVDKLSDWLMPDFGHLDFDYSSSRRPPANVAVLDDDTWTQVLSTFEKAPFPMIATQMGGHVTRGRLQALRAVSHHMYITSLQLREMLGTSSEETVRGEVFVILYNRIADIQNEKLFRVRFSDSDELTQLRDRLGHASSFPFIQPEQGAFSFDLAARDQRLAANALLQLATQEKATNLRSYSHSFRRPDGKAEEDTMPMGVPRSWEALANMPTEGVFKVSYMCAPEDRKMDVRRRLVETYGCWPAPFQEQDVIWWSSLNEVPMEVLEYLEFLSSRFDDVYQAFAAIDGEKGNGKLTLREFEASIKAMKCRKFKGHNESQKIQDIFRYLDPSGEGQISKREWAVLEQAWKEINLSIAEFVQFCDRTWPPRSGAGLEECWEALDEDGSGQISKKEWRNILRKFGFFGPAMPLFRFLDTDVRGTITPDEFRILRRYRNRRGHFSRPGTYSIVD